MKSGDFISRDHPLRILFWETTSRCNLQCVHCRRVEAGPTGGELTTAQGRALLEEIARIGSPLVILSGGEPLMRSDLFELAFFASGLGLRAALATNGTLIDQDIAGKIAASGIGRVSVSIDGADAHTHDSFRGVAGAFDGALRGLRHLQEAGVSTQINCTLSRHNLQQQERIYELARGLRVHALHWFLLVPVGCGMELGDKAQLRPREYEQVLGWIVARMGCSELEMRATCAPHIVRIMAERGVSSTIQHGREVGGACLAGRSAAFISSTGEVYPCGYLPIPCGNVTRQPFSEIWKQSRQLQKLRNLQLKGKCGRCNYRRICGGCRARAYGETGDVAAEEPFCAYQPESRLHVTQPD